MQLSTAADQVAAQLAAAAALGDDRTRQVAETLAAAAAPAVRLAVLEAASQLADEITAALLDAPGSPSVAVRLDGDEVAVDVRLPVAEASVDPARDDGEATARISLRLTDALKADIDAAAGREGVSVNTWLVRAAGAALQPRPFAGFGKAFGAPGPDYPGGRRGRPGNNQRITGWING